MSDQPEEGDKEIPPIEGESATGGDEAVVPDSAGPPPVSEPTDEPPPPAEIVEPPEDQPPASEPSDEPPPPADEAKPVEEPAPPVENEEPPGDAQPEAEPVEEPPPPAEDASQPVEESGDGPPGSETVTTDNDQVKEEEDATATASKPEGTTGDGSRRESTQSEVQALTTAQILERLKKSYAQACKTLAVIGNIQRRESVLKLEEQHLELIKKFNKFEGHLEELGLMTEQSTQTSKQSCECKSAPSEDLKPPTPQDNLPQVIICGRQEQVPKIIVCESPKKSNRKKNLAELERERLLNTQKELVNKCEFMKEKLISKETMIGNLHKQICCLQKENYMLRRQLAKKNPTQQPCQCPGTAQSACLATCPLHCRPNRADSPEPAKENSNLSQQVSKGSSSRDSSPDETQQQRRSSCGPRSVCSPTCPNFKADVPPGVDSRRSSKEESKSSSLCPNMNVETQEQPAPQGSSCGPGSVCSPTCPNFKAGVPLVDSRRSSKEESNSTSLNPESQTEDTVQQPVCPPRCPYFKANLPVVKEESNSTSLSPENQTAGTAQQHVCPPRCPYFKANLPVVKEESNSTSLSPESQTADTAQQPVCPPRCPYFKSNLAVAKEESKIPSKTNTGRENTSQHVCSTTCPYFNTKVPTVDECRRNSKVPLDAADKEVENIEVEIQEQLLGSHQDLDPCDGDKGRVFDPCPNAHTVTKSCNRKKSKQPTFCELKQEFSYLKKDLKNRMAELMTLREDIVKHKEIAERACVAQQRAEIEAKNMSDILRSIEDKQLMMLVPKERMMEIEQQIVVAKERFLESQDELEELRELTQRQTTQLDDYRSKYLQSHEQVEDQKGQIEMLELENSRISENVAMEIQHVKNQFEVRLQALAPLPDVLKATQEKVQELQRQQDENERRHEDMEKELEAAREKVREYARQLDDSVTSSNMELAGQGSMRKKLAKWEEKYNALRAEHAELGTRLTAAETAASGDRLRLTEKLHEVAQLTAALEMLRAESARQVSRAKERLDAARNALHAQILELEEQVAESRAVARTARKDRDNIRQRMQCQIDSLYENFEQAQVTIQSLQEQIGFFNDKN